MKFHYPALIGTMFLFISTIAVAQDENDHGGRLRVIEEKLQKQEAQLQEQKKHINTLLETIAAQEEIIFNTPPAGSILFLSSTIIPNGYLICDGKELLISEYKKLFDVIGTTWGGDGVKTFKLPDLRGAFPRFLDMGKGVDPQRGLGQFQNDSTKMPNNIFRADGESGLTQPAGQHSHATDTVGNHNHNNGEFNRLLIVNGQKTTEGIDHIGAEPNLIDSGIIQSSGAHSHNTNVGGHHDHIINPHPHSINGGDSETRPKNIALIGIIRY